ncbi:hypothetical protein GETHED_13580 [Geothrix edaphica]|uniref:Uncharacterized protein n=1 Tax=Geothrix edaphica TaxID=2927976 RepID=A0ABQ5PXV0_9BACT|nr:hypothetical protein GETHED_13580 [Geothrix edaphica]
MEPVPTGCFNGSNGWGGDALSAKGDCEGNRQGLQTPPEG